MATTQQAHGGIDRRGGFKRVTRIFNKLVLPLAGTPLVPLYGVLEHRGRRSGKTYRTPVVIRQSRDGDFIVPMPWGLSTDWYRNVQAAGECVVRWKGRRYVLHQPEVLDRATALAAFDSVQAQALKRFGIEQVLRLQLKTS
jgi:deazaflavin-dependent oxidoreductase (nitroreductase family)